MAGDVRSVGEELRKQGKDGPAKVADQAAERAEQVGSYLQDSNADRILRDAEDFGRRKPWAVVAGGLALGFAAAVPEGLEPAALPRGRRAERRAQRAQPRAERLRRRHDGAMTTGEGNQLRDAPTGELFKRLSQQTSELVRKEVDLAKAELTEKGKTAGKGAGMFGGAGLFGVTAFLSHRLPHRALEHRHGGVAGRPDRDRRLRGDRGRAGPGGPPQGAGGHASRSRTDNRNPQGGRPMGQNQRPSGAR